MTVRGLGDYLDYCAGEGSGERPAVVSVRYRLGVIPVTRRNMATKAPGVSYPNSLARTVTDSPFARRGTAASARNCSRHWRKDIRLRAQKGAPNSVWRRPQKLPIYQWCACLPVWSQMSLQWRGTFARNPPSDARVESFAVGIVWHGGYFDAFRASPHRPAAGATT